MNRQLYAELMAWKQSSARKPLVLRGARQVGKTHLLTEFGTKEYEQVFYLNFERQQQLKSLFTESLVPNELIAKISLYFNKDIHPGKDLLIFDEVQECPEALNSLKYFNEEANEYHVVSAGSLLGVKLANHKGFPVGKVDFLDLFPLNFFEFLEAIDKKRLRDYLETISVAEPIPDIIHQELIKLLKDYFYVGGMPEAVAEFIRSGTLLTVQKIQKNILDAYLLDFAKHAPSDQIMRISEVWQSIPNQLAKENKKFIFSVVREGARGREYEQAIQWLVDAGLIHRVYQIKTPKLPLSSFSDKKTFKTFLLDVGLLSAMNDLPPAVTLGEQPIFSEFYGAFTENFVAQELIPKKPLYYWSSIGTAEVDFIIEEQREIFPLEVKACVSRKKKSLLVYAEKYQPHKLLRASLMNLKQDNTIINCPLYLVSKINNFIRQHREKS